MIEALQPTTEQEAFADTAERCFAMCKDLEGADIAAEVGQAGLSGIMTSEHYGGLGMGACDALPVLRKAGAARLAYPLAEGVAAAWCVPELVDGERLPTVGWKVRVEVEGNGADLTLSGTVPHVTCASVADVLVIAASKGVFLVELTARGVSMSGSREMDTERPCGDVTLARVSGRRVGDEDDAVALARLGMVLRSADMLGAAESAFVAACEYTSTRRQFGKPLSAQQVVATALARDYCRIEHARVSLAYAALAWDGSWDDVADACEIAALVASDQLPSVAENAIQLHGAIGFTRDMPLHRWLRRIRTAAAIAPPHAARRSIADRLIERWSGEER